MKHITLFFISLLMFFSCYETNNTGTVYVQLRVPEKNHSLTRINETVPEGITMITVAITGLVEPVSLDMDSLELSMQVPAGTNREFVAKAFNSDNNLVYQGVTIADIKSGKETIISLTMQPVDPVEPLDPGDTESPVIIEFIATSGVKSTGTVYVKVSGTDNTAVTGWLISESSAKPTVDDVNWQTQAPTTISLSAENGAKTVYAWAKDAAGNISSEKSIAIERVAVGSENWSATIDLTYNNDNTAQSVAVDSKGNIYVVGNIFRTTVDWVVKKYSINGTDISWNTHIFDNNSYHDYATGVAIDSEDNIYVAGYSNTGSQQIYWLVKKFNSDGVEQWSYTATSTSNSAQAHAIAVDKRTNDVYVAGSFYDSEFSDGWWIKKFTSSGTEYSTGDGWDKVIQISSTNAYSEVATGIAVDSTGDVYVVGTDYNSDAGYNWHIKKFESNGDEYGQNDGWDQSYSSATSDSDEPRSIAIDSQNNVYIAGTGYGLISSQPSTGSDWWVKKFDSTGTSLWNDDIKYDMGFGYDYANALAVDSANDTIYIAGYLSNAAVMRAYNSAGAFQWEVTDQTSLMVSWKGIALYQGNIIVVGQKAIDGGGDWWVKSYSY